MGVPIAPETLPIYDTAVAWLKLPRINNIAMVLTAPFSPQGTAEQITGIVSNLPEMASNYKVMLYRRTAGGRGLTGPLPVCGQDAGTTLTVTATPGQGIFTIAGWSAGLPINEDAEKLVLVLMPSVAAPVVGSPQCVMNAPPSVSQEGQDFGIPPGVLGPRLISVELTRTQAAPVVQQPKASTNPAPVEEIPGAVPSEEGTPTGGDGETPPDRTGTGAGGAPVTGTSNGAAGRGAAIVAVASLFLAVVAQVTL
jgi:hypothetical protein